MIVLLNQRKPLLGLHSISVKSKAPYINIIIGSIAKLVKYKSIDTTKTTGGRLLCHLQLKSHLLLSTIDRIAAKTELMVHRLENQLPAVDFSLNSLGFQIFFTNLS